MSASFSPQTYLPGCRWCRSHPKSLRDEWRRRGGGATLGSLSVPEQMSPVLTLSRSRWVLGERSPSYGRLNGLIVKFSHGAPGYDRRQNYTVIKGHWICIGIHYFVKRLGHPFAYYWPCCLKCLKCALPSLHSSCWVTLWREESKQWMASLTKVIGFIGKYFLSSNCLCQFQISSEFGEIVGIFWHVFFFHCPLLYYLAEKSTKTRFILNRFCGLKTAGLFPWLNSIS